MGDILLISNIITLISVTALIFYIIRQREKNRTSENKANEKQKLLAEYYNKYSGIIDVDQAIKLREQELTEKENHIIQLTDEYNSKTISLNDEYQQKRQIFEKLLHEVKILEEDLELKDFGIYKPHFDFDTSEMYKAVIEETQNLQKELIKDDKATRCSTEWTVNGSRVEGRKQTKHYAKLMLRAFNGECDAAVAKVKWNNINVMEERVRRSYEAINKLGVVHQISLAYDYLDLKLGELRLTHEYQEKLHQEKEEQRQIREQMREEEKVQKEIDKALQDSEIEEKKYQEALEKARKEVEKATGAQVTRLNDKITELEKKLSEAKAQKERALSRAQLTKSGHVYVISNVGSFGENIYKIGMTRRLEPMDRIKELGDASVPFSFDVHAMIYSENAPELETRLHKAFENKKINMYNNRKEFFNVTLEEIEKEVKTDFGDIEFIRIAEAKEYRESVALQNKPQEEEVVNEVLDEFPESLL